MTRRHPLLPLTSEHKCHCARGVGKQRRAWPSARAAVLGTVLVVALAAAVPSPHAAAAQFDENEIKAAFLLNVALFVQWPPATIPGPTFVIAVSGDERLVKALEQVSSRKKVGGYQLSIRRLSDTETSCACQMLFVGGLDERRANELLRAARGQPVLTIGETTSFLREGGAIRFYTEDNRLKFRVNTESTQKAGLQVSSQLLGLASR